MARIQDNSWMDGINLRDPYGLLPPTMDKKPETPFPGVAPVVTIRRQVDGAYDQGLDMEDGKGPAKNYVSMGVGAGGKLAVDAGMHTSADEVSIPPDAAFWGIPAPIARARTSRRKK